MWPKVDYPAWSRWVTEDKPDDSRLSLRSAGPSSLGRSLTEGAHIDAITCNRCGIADNTISAFYPFRGDVTQFRSS
jgi:hypothetical protein